ncbi:TYRO protein tyrosine kinase-binding protein [Spea bombifrons]|uniref:TYRO protein tyrosine kinase-binding protein n=1 Tax=Spea bombifrons TaxID=233779 RepID=UPI002349E5F5|nr:TYRO protein tyrosine kinase-binding protein [Spea bombifrons]
MIGSPKQIHRQLAPCAMFLLLAVLGTAFGQNDCGDCFHLSSGAITGIVFCDIFITVLIALTVYFISNKIQKKKDEERNRNSQKTEIQESERTYEELQGQARDIYNDIGRARR